MSCAKTTCITHCAEITSVDFDKIKRCLQNRYVRVGSNVCDQFKRLSGCTNAASLWGQCGDVRPDDIPCPTHPIPHTFKGGIRGLMCARNPPDPNQKCPNNDEGFAKKPHGC